MTTDPRVSAARTDDSAFERLMDEFLDRLRRGERPDLDEYAARHPQLAAEIRDVFPTLGLLEVFGDPVADRPCPPRALGEYRVLREVGRGGMGVVYEAVQASLGRHVALKVLDAEQASRPNRLERFRREAKAAARLHHTNIVPVFAVGEQDGSAFYAMQYIRGQSLAAVLHELRHHPTAARPSADTRTRIGTDTDVGPLPAAHSPATYQLGKLEPNYFHTVARLGAQVADALAHAHREKVLHRDVKPGNLLLDAAGVVWVTDFGLAKLTDDDGLTETGTVLGTLAYMAPEQLDGQADERTDVYGLGATLYELACLRPAFAADGRVRLIDQVRAGGPTCPRAIDPTIPRDLETVILKAMAREPHLRYPTAAALADDLRRFADGRAVLARRSSVIGQAWRWGKRNPAVAGLLAAVFGLLLMVIGVFAVSLDRERGLSTDLSAALGDVKTAKGELQERLRETYLAGARQAVWSNRSGRRFDALDFIGKASALRPDPAVRDEVIACLALTDAAEDVGWDAVGRSQLPDRIDFTPDLTHYARPNEDSELTVYRVDGHVPVRTLPRGDRIPLACRFSPDGSLLAVSFEQAETTLEVYDWRTGESVYAGSPRFDFDVSPRPFDLTPDARTLIVADGPTIKRIDMPTRRESVLGEVAAGEVPFLVRLDPAGRRVAVTCKYAGENAARKPGWVTVFDTAGGPPIRLKHPSDCFGVGWSQDGRTLGVGCYHNIHLWDLTGTARERTVLRNQGAMSHDVLVHPSGRLVVTHAMDGQTRIWDVAAGQVVFRLDRHANRFSADGTRLSFRGGGRVGVWRVADGNEAVRLTTPDYRFTAPSAAAFLDEFGLLASVGADGVHLWDVTARTLAAHIPHTGPLYDTAYDPTGRWLYTVRNEGVCRWPIRPTTGGVTVGKPEDLQLNHPASTPKSVAVSRDGTKLAVTDKSLDYALLCRPGGPETTRQLPFLKGMTHVAVSADGRSVAAGRKKLTGFMVWDGDTGAKREMLLSGGSGPVAFSPDGKRLATCEGTQLKLWDAWTGALIWEVVRPDTVTSMAVAFSPDGGTLAYTHDRNTVRLLDVTDPTRVFANLRPVPPPEGVEQVVFNAAGDMLAVLSPIDGVRLWDVRAVRRTLAKMDLDWAARPLPVAAPRPAVRIE